MQVRLVAIGVMALTISFATAARAQPASNAGPIVIGASLPLSGGAASFGQQSRWGAELAIEQANVAGGVLGRKIGIDFRDNRCNPAEAVKSVSKMISEKAYVALFDGLCSSAALAIMPIAERASIPYVVANASATAVAEKSGVGGNKWTFKTNPTDASMADALIAWLDTHGGATNIALLGEDTDFGRAGQSGLTVALAKRNLKLASVDFYQQGTADFSTTLAKIKSKKPTYLAIYSIDADFVNAMRQLNGMGGGLPLTGRLLVDQVPVEILTGGALDGSVAVQPYSPSIDLPANTAFVGAYQKKFGELPTIGSFDSYEAARVLIDAIRRSGTAEPAAVRDALAASKFESLLGATIEFDDHNLAHNNAVILGVKAGKVVVLGFNKT